MDPEVKLVAYAAGAFTLLFVIFANPLIDLAAQADWQLSVERKVKIDP